MPYSNRYIMDQLARGRPVPKGDPQHDLHLALSRFDAMGITQAVHAGARVDQPDARGRQAAHVLMDASFSPGLQLLADPRRILACVRALLRENANFQTLHPATGVSPVGVLASLATTSVGPELRILLRQRVRWEQPISRGGPSAQQAWDDAATISSSPRPRVR